MLRLGPWEGHSALLIFGSAGGCLPGQLLNLSQDYELTHSTVDARTHARVTTLITQALLTDCYLQACGQIPLPHQESTGNGIMISLLYP